MVWILDNYEQLNKTVHFLYYIFLTLFLGLDLRVAFLLSVIVIFQMNCA